MISGIEHLDMPVSMEGLVKSVVAPLTNFALISLT